MKHFTLLFALLLSFAGLSSYAQTGGGVVPQLSTSDGTQYAYYIRNIQYPTSFLGEFNNLVKTTTTVSSALAVSIEKNSDGTWTFYALDENFQRYEITGGSTNGTAKVQAAGPPQVWITGSNSSADYLYNVTSVEGDYATYYLLSKTNTAKNLYAPKADSNDGKLYTSNYSGQKNAQWQFIPANDAAKEAAKVSIKMLSGDATHGNLATFSAPYATVKPEGYSVYTASESDNVMTLTELSESVIPANVGVLVRGNVSEAVDFAYSTTAATSNATSVLTATAASTKTVGTDETIYGLGVASGELAFCKVNANTTIGANKAYYAPTSGSGSAIRMTFDDGKTTAIISAQAADAAPAATYDLSGRLVKKAAKGIYIQGGKKIIVK